MKTHHSLPDIRSFFCSLAALALSSSGAFAGGAVANLNAPYTVDIELQKPVAAGTELKVKVYVVDRDPDPTTGTNARVHLAGPNEAVPNNGIVKVKNSFLSRNGISAEFIVTPKPGATQKNLLIMVKELRPQGQSRAAKGFGIVAVRDVTGAPVSTPIGVGGR